MYDRVINSNTFWANVKHKIEMDVDDDKNADKWVSIIKYRLFNIVYISYQYWKCV